ncbi:Reactive oxygen species modulator 1 [Gaertneriomyces sp. JEL0708]|nr:Reactive oxygen species modulator 1 [Gaertneriomyces sp. JEL0708]
MGFMMGASAGACVGFLYGSMTVLRGGPEPGRGYISTVGKYMLQHGAMLGFFLSIGAFLRAEESSAEYAAYQQPSTIWALNNRPRLPVVIEEREWQKRPNRQ